MVNYTCPRCGYTTINKTYIVKHLNRKRVCPPIREDTSPCSLLYELFKNVDIREQSDKNITKDHPKFNKSDHLDHPSDHPNQKSDHPDHLFNKKILQKDHPDHPNLTIVTTEKKIPFIQAIPRNDRICPGCNKEFKQKHGLYRHKKKSCKMINYSDNIYNDNISILDKGLGKEFFENDEKITQLLNLKKNKQYEVAVIDKDVLIDQLKEKDKVIQVLSNQIEHLLKEGKANIQLNTTNNDNRITQNNYYILNAFGNEKTDYINKDMIERFIKEGAYSSISKLVKEIHFHPEHPDNCNVMIPNRKQDFAKVFDGQKWVYKKKKTTLEKMSDKAFYILSQHYEGGNKYMDTFKEEYENGDKNVVKRINNDTELTVLNNQNVIYNPEIETDGDDNLKIKDI